MVKSINQSTAYTAFSQAGISKPHKVLKLTGS